MASGRSYWNRKVTLIASLLVVWAFVGFGLSIFGAETLNEISLGGIPLGFWMAQQGSIFVFVLLLLFFAIASDRLDKSVALPHATDSLVRQTLDDGKPSDSTPSV